MARGGKKNADSAAAAPQNPQAEERQRLKRLALSKNMLSDAPAKAYSAALSPSKIVAKHHGRDILKKSQRKNKYLFSFPGLLAPISGGKIGELKDLGTKNPILYLDFPQGQMKLFGTIIYPKTRYLTLQFSRGGKNVMCEDYFDSMVVFSDTWWIGTKDENPEEARLEFPKELNEGKQADINFKGGAGGAIEKKQSVTKPAKEISEPESPEIELQDDFLDGQDDLRDKIKVTPTRSSARTAGKSFKFQESSSGEDSPENNIELSEEEEKEVSLEDPTNINIATKNEDDIDDEDDVAVHIKPKECIQKSTTLATKTTSLVQATISTLFKKVEEKKTPGKLRSSTSKVSGQNSENADPKQKTDKVEVEGSSKKGKAIQKRKTGKSLPKKKQIKTEVEDDGIEEFSSMSEDIESSDEDWN